MLNSIIQFVNETTYFIVYRQMCSASFNRPTKKKKPKEKKEKHICVWLSPCQYQSPLSFFHFLYPSVFPPRKLFRILFFHSFVPHHMFPCSYLPLSTVHLFKIKWLWWHSSLFEIASSFEAQVRVNGLELRRGTMSRKLGKSCKNIRNVRIKIDPPA